MKPESNEVSVFFGEKMFLKKKSQVMSDLCSLRFTSSFQLQRLSETCYHEVHQGSAKTESSHIPSCLSAKRRTLAAADNTRKTQTVPTTSSRYSEIWGTSLLPTVLSKLDLSRLSLDSLDSECLFKFGRSGI